MPDPSTPCPGPGGLAGWTRRLLALHSIKPRDRLGQNFLVDPRGVKKFTSLLPEAGEALEIGPGLGALTLSAATRIKRILAVEADPRLAAILARVAGECAPGVLVARGDGLQALAWWRGWLVYSNTPYNLSTEVVVRAARNNSIRVLVLGVQAEVAYRLAAEPGTSDYGRITLLAQRYFRVEVASRIPRSWYHPRPKVDGAIVRLERMRDWQPGDEVYEAVTACLYTGRNRLASKMARICSERLGLNLCLPPRLRDARVRDLTPWDVEEMIQCTSAGGGV